MISSLGKTPEREKVIDFSTAYAPYFQGVFGPADIKVSGPADLTGKTVGATRGALEEIALTQMAPNATIKRFEDNNATISAFLSGQVQLIAAGNIVAAAILAKNPPRRPEAEVRHQELAVLRRHEQERTAPAGQGQCRHRAGEEGRHARSDVEEVVRPAAAGEPVTRI